MHLRQLSYFLKVAEHRSISVAAAELNVTQPSLTKSMKLLEEELGIALFRRLPRGVELTEAGRRLLHHAETVGLQLSDARNELDALRDGDRGAITIGAGPAWLRSHLPVAVSRAIAVRPNLHVRVVGGFDEALLRALRRGELDFVVAELPWTTEHRDLAIEPLSADGLCVYARKEHPLSRRGPAGLADVLRFPWVLPVRATRARQRLDALFVARNTAPPEPAIETDSMAFLLAMVRNSDALTYTTTSTIEMPEGDGLAKLAVPELTSERRAGIIRRRNSWLSPAAGVLIEELRSVCAAQPQN